MRRFGLTGMVYAGVTTLAHNLEAHYGWTHLNYSDTLKHYLALFLTEHKGGDADDWFRYILANKDFYRAILQEMGTVFGYDNGFGLDRLINEWTAAGAHEPVVVEKLRTNQQAGILRQLGFFIVEVQISHDTQYARAKQLGISVEELKKKLEHPIEQTTIVPDIIISGECSQEELCGLFLRMADQPLPVDKWAA